MIVPTVGRIVHVRFRDMDSLPASFKVHDLNQPCSATVAYVFSDHCVNLSVVDHGGVTHQLSSVRLLQDDDKPNGEGYYAEWMPFQKGQSGATDKAAAVVADAGAVHQALEAKGTEILGYLTSVEERIKGFLAEGHDKLVAAATHVESVVAKAMQAPAARDAELKLIRERGVVERPDGKGYDIAPEQDPAKQKPAETTQNPGQVTSHNPAPAAAPVEQTQAQTTEPAPQG